MQHPRVWIALLILAASATAQGPAPNSQPNPYKTITGWLQIPAGRTWGAAAGVHVTGNGHIWVFERCGANDCANSQLAPIFEFDANGKMLRNFGAGMFNFPHGIFIDREGNVWVTDTHSGGGKGQQAIKFNSQGKELMRLGKAGVTGNGQDTFNQPSDVVVAPNGDIFVADGHDEGTNARIVKFSKDGKFIQAFGKLGSGPGELDRPHGLAMDSQGRLFVADRGNNRIQIFSQDGKSLATWSQFSRPSGVYIDAKDVLYVSDSESNAARQHGEWQRGVRVGSAKDGSVAYFIPDSTPLAQQANTSSGEGVAADARGVIYSAEVGPKGDLKKYVKVK